MPTKKKKKKKVKPDPILERLKKYATREVVNERRKNDGCEEKE